MPLRDRLGGERRCYAGSMPTWEDLRVAVVRGRGRKARKRQDQAKEGPGKRTLNAREGLALGSGSRE